MGKGSYTFSVRSAALRWGACAVVAVGAAACAVAVVESAAAQTVLYLAARYPMPAETLVRAHEFEPDNPEASRSLALYYMDMAQPPDVDAAGRLLDESIAAGPNRFQTWLDLGRYLELTGRNAEAERAYQRAAALAPSGWKPQWALGNLFLREGKTDDAVEALRSASERNTEVSALVVRTVWRATGGDLALTSRAASDSVRGRSDLLGFLLAEHREDDALAVWTALAGASPADDAVAAYGRQVAAALVGAGRVDDAMGVWARIAPDEVPVPDRIGNPGFEDAIPERAPSPFVWTIVQSPEARVSLDAGRSGGKALRVDYKVKSAGSLSQAREYVRVRAGASYTLSFWAKTDDLQSGGLPRVAVADATRKDRATVAGSLPAGTTDWTEYRVAFRAPASGLVEVAAGRERCGDVCPIYGSIWIDDLSLVAN